MIRLKYNHCDADIEIEMIESKKKANRKAEVLFLLFTLLTLYPDMLSETFR